MNSLPASYLANLDTKLDSDGPGDNTHKPCRPERRVLLEQEYEKLLRWGGAQQTDPPVQPEPEGTPPDAGS